MDGLRMVGDFDGLVQLSHLPDEVVLDSFRVAQNGIVFGKWKVLKRWGLGELGLDGEEQWSVVSGQVPTLAGKTTARRAWAPGILTNDPAGRVRFFGS
jgi:hypothetical protein